MMIHRILLPALLCAALAGAAPPPLSPPTSEAPETALFNGKDLAGWYTFLKGRGKGEDPKGVFAVKDGRLLISGEEWGCITTEAEYASYYFFAEWRWAGPTHGDRKDRARDSGIIVHSQGEDGGYSGTWMHGIEVQIIEGGTGDFIVVSDGSDRFALTAPAAPERHGETPVYSEGGTPATIAKGRFNWWGRDPGWTDTLGFRGARDLDKPTGEWNRLEVFARGAALVVLVNGVQVNGALEVKPERGRIQIQSEGAAIEFRKIGLLPLDEVLDKWRA